MRRKLFYLAIIIALFWWLIPPKYWWPRPHGERKPGTTVGQIEAPDALRLREV